MTRFVLFLCTARLIAESVEAADRFHAVGPSEPIVEYLDDLSSEVPRELRRVAVEVHFERVPTMMRFSMPCYPCMVAENGIHYSNGWTETYDPKASSSCEVLWDRQARYARMWIKSQTPARIVVRARAALTDPDGYIAHSDIPSGSPYGKGDWTDEWYYIYPDGTHTRHVRIYTGLAGQSLTVTDETFQGRRPIREIPPNVVHEFQEGFIFGQRGHIPTDDIDTSPLTLIMMDGRSETISYDPYPSDFGIFTKANIKLVNLKSEYRPFTISIPHGIENEPYPPEGELPQVFQTWPRNPRERGYSTSLGHILNWWHYRRTENILEQIYLSGMTAEKEPTEQLVNLARSWLEPPQLLMKGYEPSYGELVYDPAQRAYVLPRRNRDQEILEFALGNPDDDARVSIVNPTFIFKNWGRREVRVSVNGEELTAGKLVEIGYENTDSGTDLILWIPSKSNTATRFKIHMLDD